MAGRPVVARICARAETEADLADYLARRGFDVRLAHEDWSATALLARGDVDIAMVDMGLPGADPMALLRAHAGGDGPDFIMVDDKSDVVDRVLALELGAADVISRPLVPREVVSRIDGLLARRGRVRGELVRFEHSTVDLRAALVMHNSGGEEQLSPGQIALVRLFADHPRKVLGREDIMAAAPAESFDAFDRSVDSRIVRLRRKLDTESIVTVRGSGYRFDPPA